jgi:uncharacterized membrane protein YczE
VALLESKLGLSPWDVLNQGIARHSPLSFGLANIAVGVIVLVLAWALGGPPGLGTVANAVLIGLFIEGLLRIGPVADLSGSPLAARAGLLPLGIALMGIGSAFYIGASYGAGPRDTLMLVLARRTGRRIGLVRAGIEAAALVAGFALGGTVGIGTLAFALLIGPSVEAAFWILARSPLVAQQGVCGSEPQTQ